MNNIVFIIAGVFFLQEIFVVVNIWNLQCYSLIVLMFQLDIKILLDNVSILFDCSFGTYNVFH